MQISIITRGNRKFRARVSRFGQSGAARRFVAFFSEPLGSLIKYFLGVHATAGHIPESVAAKVPGMFKASERKPRDIVRSEIPPPSSRLKLRGP